MIGAVPLARPARARRQCAELVLFAMITGLVLLPAGRAHADDLAAARELFRKATDAAAHGDHRTAAELFEDADRNAPRANAVFNAGEAWDEAGDSLRAADAYATALERGDLDAKVADVARARLTDLETKLQASVGSVRVTGPPGARASVAHASKRPVPLRVHVSPGDVVVTVERSGGGTTRHTVTVEAGKITVLTPPVDVPLPAPTATPPKLAAPPIHETPKRAWMRPLGWTLFATGVAAAGVGVGLGVRGLDARNEWDQAQHDPSQINLHDAAVNLRTWANVSFAAAGLVGGTGVVLLFLAPASSSSGPPARKAAIDLTPGRAQVSFAF
jgi:hypothetical protein